MGKGDAEGIWDAAMGEMTRWVLGENDFCAKF